MLAYHNKPELKDEYLARLAAHAAADEIIKGQYWEDGKGCAVGCTIHGSDHSRYETELGIPQVLARLEDCIFEGLPNGEAKKFPRQFLAAIRPGADISKVGIQFMISVQRRNLKRLDQQAHPDVAAAIKGSMKVLRDWLHGRLSESAARSAESAAESAARSAESAARSAESAAWSAAWSAESAESAAWSAARSAESAARSAEYTWMAKTLIRHLKAA